MRVYAAGVAASRVSITGIRAPARTILRNEKGDFDESRTQLRGNLVVSVRMKIHHQYIIIPS